MSGTDSAGKLRRIRSTPQPWNWEESGGFLLSRPSATLSPAFGGEGRERRCTSVFHTHPNPSGVSGSPILGLESVRWILGFGLERMVACLPLLLCTLALPLLASEPADRTSAPFLRFRERTLEYNGPEGDEGDLQNVHEVNIAWFGPYDGTNHLTADLWCAANLAVQEANEKGGFKGLPIRLVPSWAVDPWGTGISQLARTIYSEQAVAVLGSVDSSATHLAEQVVAKAQLPLVSPVATDKSVTLAGVSWMFSCAPSDDAIARVLVNDVIATLANATNNSASEKPGLALITCTDHESRMTAREVLKEFTRRQRPPDFRFDVPPGAMAITNQMAAIEQIKPGAILIVARAEDAARLVKAVRERMPGSVIFGTHSMSRARFLELASQAAEGVRFPQLFEPNHTEPATAHFLERFNRQQQHPPDYAAAMTYDATRLLIDAIGRGGLNRARIREALVQLSPWMGVAGVIRWDGTGQNTRTNVGMGTIRGGAIESLTTRATLRQTAKQP